MTVTMAKSVTEGRSATHLRRRKGIEFSNAYVCAGPLAFGGWRSIVLGPRFRNWTGGVHCVETLILSLAV